MIKITRSVEIKDRPFISTEKFILSNYGCGPIIGQRFVFQTDNLKVVTSEVIGISQSDDGNILFTTRKDKESYNISLWKIIIQSL